MRVLARLWRRPAVALGYGHGQALEDGEEARIAVLACCGILLNGGVPVKVKCDLDVRRRARYVLLDVFHGHVGVVDALYATVILSEGWCERQAVLQGTRGLKVLHDGMQEAVGGGVGDSIDFGVDLLLMRESTKPERGLGLAWCERLPNVDSDCCGHCCWLW